MNKCNHCGRFAKRMCTYKLEVNYCPVHITVYFCKPCDKVSMSLRRWDIGHANHMRIEGMILSNGKTDNRNRIQGRMRRKRQ